MLPVLWLLNSLWVLAYFATDHSLVALLLPTLVWLGVTAPIKQQLARSKMGVTDER